MGPRFTSSTTSTLLGGPAHQRKPWLGELRLGTFGSAALVGATDVDALVYSMVKLGDARLSAEIAAQALGIGILSNTALKLGIALVIGRVSYRLLAGASLLARAIALAVSLLFF